MLYLKGLLLFGRILFLQQCACGRNGLGAVTAFVDDTAFTQQYRIGEHGFLLQTQHCHTLGITCGLGQQLGGREDGCTAVSRVYHHLVVCIHGHGLYQRTLVRIRTGKLFPVGFGFVSGQRHLGCLAVFKEEQYKPLIVPTEHQSHQILTLLEAQLLGR